MGGIGAADAARDRVVDTAGNPIVSPGLRIFGAHSADVAAIR
jgi:hypothetical protein